MNDLTCCICVSCVVSRRHQFSLGGAMERQGGSKTKLSVKQIVFLFTGKVELHGKLIEVEHSVPKRQR